MNGIAYTIGIDEAHRDEAALLYDEAFGAKLSVAIPDRDRRVALLRNTMLLDHALGAVAGNKLVGLAGFQTEDGSLTSGITVRGMMRHLGLWGGLRALAVLMLYQRSAAPGELVTDGISVSATARGQGIGSGLLQALMDLACERDYKRIRLDVIDTNAGARRLYERLGFEAVSTESVGPLAGILGFSASTRMHKMLST